MDRIRRRAVRNRNQIRGRRDDHHIELEELSLLARRKNWWNEIPWVIWYIIVAVFCVVIGICFLTNIFQKNETEEKTTSDTKKPQETTSSYTTTIDLPSTEHFEMENCGMYRHDMPDPMEILTFKDYPFIVGIMVTNDKLEVLNCRGTFISPYQIITASHCHNKLENSYISKIYFYDTRIDEKIFINFADLKYESNPKFKYNDFEYNFDIALIEIKDPAKYSSACVQPLYTTNAINDNTLVIFEILNDGSMYPTTLRMKQVELTGREECSEQFRKINMNIKFFADSREELHLQLIFCIKSSDYIEKGHSGSPLLSWDGSNFMVHGVLSYGPTESNKNVVPYIFTNVSPNLEWIVSAEQK